MKQKIFQLYHSWTNRHTYTEISPGREMCEVCGKGWFFDPIYYMWRVDTDTPGSAP